MNRDYPDRPIVGVIAIVRRGERFLLVRRGKAPNKGLWGFPGGVQELGETVVQAAERELAEETGAKGRDPRILTSLDVIERDLEGRVARHFTLVAVAMDWVAGEGEAADDADAAGWFGVQDIDGLAVLPAVERLMRQALAG